MAGVPDRTTGKVLPRYKSHKVVSALKIFDMKPAADGGATIVPAEDGYAPFQVSGDYVRKHDPQVGGYFVVYQDGYMSWSPAEAFESGYKKIETVDSTSDERTVNNVMRHEYRVLDEHEKMVMVQIKDMGLAFHEMIVNSVEVGKVIDPRCGALAKTKIEEAVMWAVKGLTE